MPAKLCYTSRHKPKTPENRTMKYCPICKTCYDDYEDRCQKDRIFLVEAFPGERTVDTKYRIDALIGQGGMGAVYRATHLELDRAVALKVVLPDFVSSGENLERFRREARASARLNHPNVITIYDFGVLPNGRAYLAMELLSGRSLRDEIERAGMLSPRRTLEILKPICEAVQAAHNAGVIHRDLKPDNIVMEKTEAGIELVKVVDFGIAKLRETPGIKAMTLTGPGLVMGTPHYMSPEQCKGEELDTRSDVYSLGVMLYEMISGHVPFDAPTPSAVIIQHAIDPPRRISQLRRDVTPEVEDVIMRSLAKNRIQRQQSVIDLYTDLEKAINYSKEKVSSPVQPSPTPPPAPAPKSVSLTPKANEVLKDVEILTEESDVEDYPIDSPTLRPEDYEAQQEIFEAANNLKREIKEGLYGGSNLKPPPPEPPSYYPSDRISANVSRSELDDEASEILAHTREYPNEEIGLSEAAVLQGHEHVVKSICFTPEGKYLISASSDGNIKIWDLKKKRVRGALRGHELSVNSLTVSPKGDLLASAGSDGTVRVWNLAKETEIASFNNYEGSLRCITFSPNSLWLALANNADVELLDIASKKRIAHFQGHVRLVESVEFSRDGNTIISAGVDESIRFWDSNKKSLLGMINCHDHCINSLTCSVDGILASAGKDHTIRLWDIASRTELAIMEGHKDSVRTIVFSARGDYLISGDWGGVIKLWDTATGLALASVEAHDGAVLSVAFSPDEKQVASAGYDQLIKLWNIDGLIDI